MAGLSAMTALALLTLAGLRWYASARSAEPLAVATAADTATAAGGADRARPLTREELMWLEDRPADTVPESLFEDTLRLPHLQLAATIDELRQLPADRISASNAALLLARKYHREFEPQPLEQRLDDMAREVGLRLSVQMLPSARVQSLLDYLYLRDRFKYEADAEWFDDMLQRGRGGEMPLAVLVLACGQRLGMPFHAVRVPQGCWLRIPVEGGQVWYINAADGTHTDEEGMRRKLGLLDITVRRAHWLGELDLRGVVAELYARQAQLLAHQQRTVEAQEMITVGLFFDEENPGLRQLQGKLLMTTQPQEALPFLQEAANRFGADATAQYLYGRALRAAGKPAEAMPWLEKATANSSDSAAWLERAACRAELRQYTLAVADYQKTAALMPGDLTVVRGLANAYIEWGIELRRNADRAGLSTAKLAEVEQAFAQAILYYPRDPRAFILRARTRINLNKRAEAVEDLKAALTVDPNNAEARQLLMQFDRPAAIAAP